MRVLSGQRLSKEYVHGITSLTTGQATAQQLLGAVRHHWRVEICHQLRDVTWREDHQHAYTGTGAQVMAMIRNLVLAILRLTGPTRSPVPCSASPRTEPRSCRSCPASLSPHVHDQLTLKSGWGCPGPGVRGCVAQFLFVSGGLDRQARRTWLDGRAPSLRWILTHMIEEYARHNGHADLLRESVDGLTGE